MIVENAPSRIFLLYFTNMGKIFNKEPIRVYPASFPTLAHDQAYNLNRALALDGNYGL